MSVDVPPPAPLSRGRFALLSGVSIGLLTAALFNRVVFAGEWLSARDTLRVYYPLAKYFADRIRAGEFPEWYPYDALGQPYIAAIFSTVFHPSRLLYLLLPLKEALSVNILLCYPAAALGAYLCARRLRFERIPALFTAITWAFSGYIVSISNNLSYLMAAATFPFALHATDRFLEKPNAGRLTLAGLFLALVMLGGDVQAFTITGAGMLLIGLLRPDERKRWRSALLSALPIAVGIVLALPQLVPSFLVLDEARSNLLDVVRATQFSLYPLRLVELAFGPLFVSESIGLFTADMAKIAEPNTLGVWVDSIAIGLSAFVLACGAVVPAWKTRIGRAIVILTLVLGVLMLGRHLPLYGLLFKLVPLWRVFRYPEKLVAFFTFLMALGAGFALQHALTSDTARRRLGIAIAVAGGLSGLLALLELLPVHPWTHVLEAIQLPEKSISRLASWDLRMFVGGIVSAAISALVLWRARPHYRGPMLVSVQAILLVWMHLPLPQTVAVPLLSEPSGFIPLLKEKGLGLGKMRVHAGAKVHSLPRLPGFNTRDLLAAGLFVTLEPDTQALFDIESGSYYLPTGSGRIVTAINTERVFLDRLAHLYSVGYFAAQPDAEYYVAEKKLPYKKVAELVDWDIILLEDQSPIPRAYLARGLCVANEQEDLDSVRNDSFRPGLDAVVECKGGHTDTPLGSTSPGTAKIVSYAPEHVVIEADAAEASVLILNDAYYSGWTATLDGAPTEIEAANLAVRAVHLTAGHHTVEFRYRTPGLRPALSIAGLSLLLLLGAAVFERRRRG